MNYLQKLIEAFLCEATALTKGSQRVMNDKNLVMNLADAMRDDHTLPPDVKKIAKKAPDQQLAQWFLENIDNIERAGYEGTVYSREGVNSDWIVRRYIAGSHNWEDLTGVMNMNLRDWYLLKNRNQLDANHKDLPKFNSVRDVGYYMTTHYGPHLEKVRDAAKNAARNKMAKSIKLVDNDDYRIYTTLNRAAGCALGLGTQWCTANSNYGGHFHSYSKNAMLFQMFPYAKETEPKTVGLNFVNIKDENGKNELNDKEKYQFDAGGPNFMDITDRPANPRAIKERFPYLFTDLASALKANKEKMEQAFKELSDDPTLQGEDYKIKTYEIDEEIKKLHKFVDKGYFTDKVRPKPKSDQETQGENPEQPQLTQQQAPEQPQQGQPQMENVDKDVAAMLNSLKKYDKLVESVAPVLGMKTLGEKKDGKKPEWLEKAEEKAEKKEGKDKKEKVEEDGEDNPWKNLAKKDKKEDGKTTKTKTGLKHEKDFDAKSNKKDEKEDEKDDLDESADQEVLEWMKRFASLGNMKGYGR